MEMTMLSTMRALEAGRGAVRTEDVYDTSVSDLWDACTSPPRLARWIAQVSGDLHEGGEVQVVFTSTFSGPVRIEVCDPPHHLLVRMEPGTDDETELEAWVREEGEQARLVVEERGLSREKLYFHGAGWQTHLEDLRRALETGASAHPDGWSPSAPSPAWKARWDELTPTYREVEVR